MSGADEAVPSASLAELTTLRVGGTALRLVRAATEAELVQTIAAADEVGEPVLVLGGGSNLLVGDEGFAGTVVQVDTTGITVDSSACAGAEVTVAAGESWDGLVARAVDEGWVGLEAMSGIPGLVGATPIQNVGAYGAEVADTIARVRTWDRQARTYRTFAAVDCGFDYRDSRFKREPGRYVVCSVTFQLPLGDRSAPVRYAELARVLGVEIGQRAGTAEVRAAVLALRAAKGMVLDAGDHDTWSAGSFFTNPLLTPDEATALPPEAPRYPTDGERVKTSAAWLIEHAGFGRGFGVDGEPSRARLSGKHTLALTNRGSATATDLLELARTIRSGVRQAYGITLVPEPVLVGCAL